MLTRATSGAVFVIILTGAIVYSSLTLGLIFLLFSILGLHEFYKLKEVHKPQAVVGSFLGIATFAVLYFISIGELEFQALLYLIPVISLIYLFELFRKNSHPIESLGITIWGVIYAVVPLTFMSFLSMMDGTYNWIIPMGILVIIWSADTFAYLVGSLLGKRKLFEKISPKKSWEGYIGGFVMSLATAYIVSMFESTLAFHNWMIIGLIIGSLGTLGDLLESKMKRSAGIKDSGNIMPGHGGILDRFDTLLFIGPIVYFYLKMIA